MRHWWQSWGRHAAIIAGSISAALAVFMLFVLYTAPGARLLGSMIGPLSGGRVEIAGLEGNPLDHLQIKVVKLRDAKGTWLEIDGIRLDWHAFGVIADDHLDIDRLHVDRVVYVRPKVASKSKSTSSMKIDIRHLAVDRIVLKPQAIGKPAVLTAQGSIHYASLKNAAAKIVVRRLDAKGLYQIDGAITHSIARGAITVDEGGSGIIAAVLGMTELGPVQLDARAAAQGSSNTVRFRMSANLLDISGDGTIDLAAKQIDVDFSAVSPQTRLSKQISWSSLSAKGHVHGAFSRPDIQADLDMSGLDVSGTRIGVLTVALRGAGGNADLHATAADLRLSGQKKSVFASAPIRLEARVNLADKSRPVRFTLEHPLLKINGHATTRGAVAGHMAITLPSLNGVGPLIGAKVNGHAELAVDFSRAGSGGQYRANGTIATQGKTMIGRLLGGNARLTAVVSMKDAGNLSLQASLNGDALTAQLGGAITNGKQDISGKVAIAQLSRLSASLEGDLKLRAQLTGPSNNGALLVNGTAYMGAKGIPKQSLDISAKMAGLPQVKQGRVRISGRFDDAPLVVDADVARAGGGGLTVRLTDASWRSAHAHGLVVIAGANPAGQLSLGVKHLADLSVLASTPLSGSLTASAELQAKKAVIQATGHDIASGTTKIGQLAVSGTVADPLGSPDFALTASVPQLASGSLTGSASLQLNGPLNAIAIKASSNLTTASGQKVSLTTEAVLDSKDRLVALNQLEGQWRNQTVRLVQPTVIDYANGLKLDATFADRKASRLTIAGTIPSKPGRFMDVHATGHVDLAALTSGLSAVGAVVKGKMALDVTVTGTTAKPQVVGQATFTGGEIRDYAYGLDLTSIAATAEASGSLIRLTKFTAKAGPGTISGGGTVDLSTPGTPVDITFKADGARPVASNLVSLTLNADMTLQGLLSKGLTLNGDLHIRKGNINIPESFPHQVATLKVIHYGHQPVHPPSPPPPPVRVALDLAVTSPGQVFVRGRGLEAEFMGNLKVKGTTANPQVLGALTMRRGTFSLASANLTFESGKISFDGEALRHSLDPSINFVAQSQGDGFTATLKVTGTASQPEIELSSSPSMPQDEILAQLLFQQNAKSLSALQLASLAQAAATLSGGGGGFNPVGVMRKSLGLDRLAISSMPGSNGGVGNTTVEAGKYVLRNVYLAARQSFTGGTQAIVQVDITKHLKAQAQVNTGPRAANTTSTPLQDNGDSIGLSYEFEY